MSTLDPTPSHLQHVQGNLITFSADCICQVVNCVTIKSKGLSNTISTQLPYANLYQQRSKNKTLKKGETYTTPGTVTLSIPDPDQKEMGPVVAHLAGQICPSFPGSTYCKTYGIDSDLDDEYSRQLYFVMALIDLAGLVKKHKWTSIAFPHQIGCGLGGGKWSLYLDLIQDFAMDVYPTYVYIVHLDQINK